MKFILLIIIGILTFMSRINVNVKMPNIYEAIPPFSERRIPTYLASIPYAEPWYAVRQQKCKWYAYAEFCVLQDKILKIRGTKLLKQIEWKWAYFFFARSHYYILINDISYHRNLPVVFTLYLGFGHRSMI